jgi:hypothetical protein
MNHSEMDNLDAKNMYHDMVKETPNVETEAGDSDAGDMHRMGKEQQFHVRLCKSSRARLALVALLIIAPAYIPPIDHDHVHFHGPVFVGIHACVSRVTILCGALH